MRDNSEDNFEGTLHNLCLVVAHVESTEHKHSPANVEDDENISCKGCRSRYIA